MTYTMSRFAAPAASEKSVVESIQDAAKAVVMSGSIARMVQRKREQQRSAATATRALELLRSRIKPEEEEEQRITPLRRFLFKALTFAGRKLFQYVLRPTLQFAARMAMSVVRAVLTGIARFVITPLISAIVGFAVANPITAAVGAALLLGGGAYWIWDRFFAKETPAPALPDQDVDTRAEAEDGSIYDPVFYRAPGAVGTPSIEQIETQPSSLPAFIAEPVQYVKEQYKRVTGKKFTGFGADVDTYIKEAVQLYPILKEDELRGFIKMEAGWTGAMSPTGAIGTGQFILSTWNGLAAKPEGKAIGMVPIPTYKGGAPIPANKGGTFRTANDPRFNKRVNTLATALLASENAAMLKKNKLPITGANLYMMHNIGPGIIPVMLGKPASEATLKAMRQNGMLKGQTAVQFLEYQKGRFATAYSQANDSTVTSGVNPRMTNGTAVAIAQPKVLQAPKKVQVQQPQTLAQASDKTLIKQGRKIIELEN